MKKLLIIIALVLLAGLPFVDWVVRNYSSNSPVALGQAGVPFVPIPTLPVYPGPVGPGSACALTEWICRDGDVIVPPVECHAVHYNPDTGEYSCRFCALTYIDPMPSIWDCPTNQDYGQKDGTAVSQDKRTYYYYDYEQGSIINVPPYQFGGSP
jgi:hypothetical protein